MFCNGKSHVTDPLTKPNMFHGRLCGVKCQNSRLFHRGGLNARKRARKSLCVHNMHKTKIVQSAEDGSGTSPTTVRLGTLPTSSKSSGTSPTMRPLFHQSRYWWWQGTGAGSDEASSWLSLPSSLLEPLPSSTSKTSSLLCLSCCNMLQIICPGEGASLSPSSSSSDFSLPVLSSPTTLSSLVALLLAEDLILFACVARLFDEIFAS